MQIKLALCCKHDVPVLMEFWLTQKWPRLIPSYLDAWLWNFCTIRLNQWKYTSGWIYWPLWIDSKMNIQTSRIILQDEYTDQQDYIFGWIYWSAGICFGIDILMTRMNKLQDECIDQNELNRLQDEYTDQQWYILGWIYRPAGIYSGMKGRNLVSRSTVCGVYLYKQINVNFLHTIFHVGD